MSTDPIQGKKLGLLYEWPYKSDDWNSGMDANLKRLDVLVAADAQSVDYDGADIPDDGYTVIVPSQTSTAAFRGNENSLAIVVDGEWVFHPAKPGLVVYDRNQRRGLRYTGRSWESLVEQVDLQDFLTSVDIEGLTSADQVNELINDALPDLSDYATRAYVNSSIQALEDSLVAYATTDYVDQSFSGLASRTYVDQAVSNVQVDLTGYATEDFVTEAVSGLASTEYVDQVLSDAGAAMGTVTSVNGVDPVEGVVTLAASDISAIPLAQKGAPNGVATLDANGLLTMDQLPAIKLNTIYQVASTDEMIALDAQMGDVAVVDDGAGATATYMLKQLPASTLENWVALPGTTNVDLSNYVTQSQLTTTLNDYATVAELQNYVKNGTLAAYVKKTDADANYATKTELNGYLKAGGTSVQTLPVYAEQLRSPSTASFNAAQGNFFKYTFTANGTIALSAPNDTLVHTLTLELLQAATFSVSFPTNVKWLGGTAPTMTTHDVVTLYTTDGGTTWIGNYAGKIVD